MKKQEHELENKLINEVRNQVVSTVRVLGDKQLTVGFAESCTGGLLSSFFGEVSGVSSVFMGSIVSYDNAVKTKFLKVSEKTLKDFGAVSSSVAQQMAEGAVSALEVKVAAAITGIAGPTGGSAQKPVGTVFIAVAGLNRDPQVFEHHFSGDRKQVQLQAVQEALKHLKGFIN